MVNYANFFEKELTAAKDKGMMVSLHMKATMMKVSDPIIFGHCVKVYYKDVFAKHAATFEKIGANPNNGIGDIYDKIASLPDAERKEIEDDIMKVYETRPGLAMVNSNKGITNLHVPSDVIIDASMPCVVRDSGKMWNKDDALEDVMCMILTVATHHSTRQFWTTARKTANSTFPPWAMYQTSV